ncbi:hypothetical protein [Bordetella sp. N]|uniref:hypothetical protein n=1 Tax=Bordetella sp. N TaxID=1746199 RepID=UPI00070F3D11|nr:hypothetical protein [Bordetella sp. N]ALM83705.1 hypothetical protein ASB57_12625 [Bordetella sp. N]
MNKRSGKAPVTENSTDAPRGTSLNARIFPPATPVDVPNLPPKKAKAAELTPDGAKPLGPSVETDAEHNWADSTQPAPYKKKARTSIF